MEADLVRHSAGQARRQQADRDPARGGQRADVYPEHRLPMAGDPERPAAALRQAGLRKVGWVWTKTGWEACPEALADRQKIPVQMKRRARRAGEGGSLIADDA